MTDNGVMIIIYFVAYHHKRQGKSDYLSDKLITFKLLNEKILFRFLKMFIRFAWQFLPVEMSIINSKIK